MNSCPAMATVTVTVELAAGAEGKIEVYLPKIRAAILLIQRPVLSPVGGVVEGVGGIDGVVDAIGEFLVDVERVDPVVVVVAVAEFAGGAIERADLPDALAVDVGRPSQIAGVRWCRPPSR